MTNEQDLRGAGWFLPAESAQRYGVDRAPKRAVLELQVEEKTRNRAASRLRFSNSRLSPICRPLQHGVELDVWLRGPDFPA